MGEALDSLKEMQNWLSERRGLLLAFAIVMMAATMQFVLRPPGGVWQGANDSDDAGAKIITVPPHRPGSAVLLVPSQPYAGSFVMCTAISFGASFGVILLLVSGLPLKHRIYFWISIALLVVGTNAIYWACGFALVLVVDPDLVSPSILALSIIWFAFVGILGMGYMVQAVRGIGNFFRRRSAEAQQFEK